MGEHGRELERLLIMGELEEERQSRALLAEHGRRGLETEINIEYG